MSTLSRIGRLSASTAASLVVMGVTPGAVMAATVDVFLISDQTAPTSSTGSLSFDTINVYQLDLNGNKKAASAKLIDNFTFNATGALTFSNQSTLSLSTGAGPIDSVPGTYQRSIDPLYAEYEPGAGTSEHVNAQVGTWDDAFIDNGGADNASLNLDMHRNTWATFNPVSGGFTDLVIAEVGALTPLALSLCPDAACSTIVSVFEGFTAGLGAALANMPQFTVDERSASAGELDQTFLFRFSEPIYDYLRITEVGDRNFYTGERLEIDYLGVGSSSTTGSDTISVVPLPASLPMLVAGLGLLGWVSRRMAE